MSEARIYSGFIAVARAGGVDVVDLIRRMEEGADGVCGRVGFVRLQEPIRIL
jgi:hypothetical protein